MIRIKDLYKSFHGNEVLKGISAEIKKGEVVAIIGPSGSGKSTLLRCINLLELPTSGNIFFNGKDITEKGCNLQKLRQKIGMVFQHFHLFPHMNVLDNITFAPMKVLGKSRKDAETQALELLRKVGLKDKAHVYPVKLSGGQKQRVAIARALAMDPEVILFDEPTSSLDPEMVKEVLDVIKNLAKTKITMAIVTHEMGFAREVADSIWFLDEGILLEEQSPVKFFKSPLSERAREFLKKVL